MFLEVSPGELEFLEICTGDFHRQLVWAPLPRVWKVPWGVARDLSPGGGG